MERMLTWKVYSHEELKRICGEKGLRYNPRWDDMQMMSNKTYYLWSCGGRTGLQTESQMRCIKAARADGIRPALLQDWNFIKANYSDIKPEQEWIKSSQYRPAAENTSVWTKNKKKEYRLTNEWQYFAWSEKEKRKVGDYSYRCDDCGKEFGELEVHHLDPTNYSVLEPKRFKCLCDGCHMKYTEDGE